MLGRRLEPRRMPNRFMASCEPAAVTRVFTIGHSNRPRERFMALLRMNGITAVADVRSKPFSRRHPHFNQPALKKALEEADIAYLFLGESLGGQPADAALYRNNVPDYERMAATDGFQRALDRVLDEATGHRLALMCAEKEPLECHRFLLVSRHLALRDARITHILGDGSIEEHERTLRRLLAVTRLDAGELFASAPLSEDVLARAFELGHRRLFGRRNIQAS
jgi:uncharacterized protein (DUF488 family)